MTFYRPHGEMSAMRTSVAQAFAANGTAGGPSAVRGALQQTTAHRSRQLRPLRPGHPVADLSQERIKRRPVLGGLINEYERAA